MSSPRTVAIIQARMGSSRMPGKVMMNLGARSMLGYLLERLTTSRTIDDFVVATTTNSRDDIIVGETLSLGVRHFRGSETDVLGRYLGAAREFHAEIVVRVTADNPFTDPYSIDRVVEQLSAAPYDYAIENNMPLGTTGEALTADALAFIDRSAHTERWREHVTLFAKENPHLLRCAFLSAPPEFCRPELSYTVDHFHEYQQVREISTRFTGPHFPLKDLIALADNTLVV